MSKDVTVTCRHIIHHHSSKFESIGSIEKCLQRMHANGREYKKYNIMKGFNYLLSNEKFNYCSWTSRVLCHTPLARRGFLITEIFKTSRRHASIVNLSYVDREWKPVFFIITNSRPPPGIDYILFIYIECNFNDAGQNETVEKEKPSGD